MTAKQSSETPMIRLDQMRQARRTLDHSVRDLQEQVKSIQERCEMKKGSVYQRQRRCGKRNCGCWEGPAHVGWVVSLRQSGRRVGMSINEAGGEETKKLVENYQRFRKARREIIRTWQRLLKTIDALGVLREVETEGRV